MTVHVVPPRDLNVDSAEADRAWSTVVAGFDEALLAAGGVRNPQAHLSLEQQP